MKPNRKSQKLSPVYKMAKKSNIYIQAPYYNLLILYLFHSVGLPSQMNKSMYNCSQGLCRYRHAGMSFQHSRQYLNEIKSFFNVCKIRTLTLCIVWKTVTLIISFYLTKLVNMNYHVYHQVLDRRA